jgi:hypothetical protein
MPTPSPKPPSTALFISLTTHKSPTSAPHPTNTFVITRSKRHLNSNNSSSQHSDSSPSAPSNTNTTADNNANTITNTTFSPHSQPLTTHDEELKHIQAFLTNPSSLVSTPFAAREQLIK